MGNCIIETAVNVYGQLVITLAFTPESGLYVPGPITVDPDTSLKLAKSIIFLHGLNEEKKKP